MAELDFTEASKQALNYMGQFLGKEMFKDPNNTPTGFPEFGDVNKLQNYKDFLEQPQYKNAPLKAAIKKAEEAAQKLSEKPVLSEKAGDVDKNKTAINRYIESAIDLSAAVNESRRVAELLPPLPQPTKPPPDPPKPNQPVIGRPLWADRLKMLSNEMAVLSPQGPAVEAAGAAKALKEFIPLIPLDKKDPLLQKATDAPLINALNALEKEAIKLATAAGAKGTAEVYDKKNVKKMNDAFEKAIAASEAGATETLGAGKKRQILKQTIDRPYVRSELEKAKTQFNDQVSTLQEKFPKKEKEEEKKPKQQEGAAQPEADENAALKKAQAEALVALKSDPNFQSEFNMGTPGKAKTRGGFTPGTA